VIDDAVRALRRGRFVLLHDSEKRENEIDLVIACERVTARRVAEMRTLAGGLICVSIHPVAARNLGLPYMTEIYREAEDKFRILEAARPDDIPYDGRSAFSITVNHRKTFTGVTDRDRAMTIRELGRIGRKAMRREAVEEFGRSFRSPGHVHLLRAADGLLKERQGHTELSVALAEMAGITPLVAICEVLDGGTGGAANLRKARRLAELLNTTLISGKEVADFWRGWIEEGRNS
jgi:3,4-dihydroxy 2-butanone 4-phosphate synthase